MKKQIVISFIAILMLSQLALIRIANADGENWLSGYLYRQKLTWTNSTNIPTGYQLNFTITNGTGTSLNYTCFANGHVKNTYFYDVRVTTSDGSTMLSIWNQTCNFGNATQDYNNATIWFNSTSDWASSQSVIYIYYGNDGAVSAFNGFTTFFAFDDFASSTLDGNWTFYHVQNGRGSGGWYSLTNNTGMLQIYGEPTGAHDSWTGITRAAPSGDYQQMITANGTWNTNYYDSGLYLGQQTPSTSISNWTNGQIMHESSAVPHTTVWLEYHSVGVRSVPTPITRFTEPSWPAFANITLTKLGTNYWENVTIDGSTYGSPTASYPGTAAWIGITANNDDGSNYFLSSFDNYICRPYASPEPTPSTWGAEEIAPVIYFYLIFYNNSAGQFKVNDTTRTNGTAIAVVNNTYALFNISAFPDGGYIFSSFDFNSTSNTSNPYNANITSIISNMTFWVTFSKPSGGGMAILILIGGIVAACLIPIAMVVSRRRR